MTVDTTNGTPGYWLLRLGAKLQADLPRMDRLDRYRSGDHPLPEGHRRHKALFRQLQRKARTNYTGLVVEAVAERLHIDGFRSGTGADQTEDKEAWARWQFNSLDADSDIVHDGALTFGRAYVIVGQNAGDESKPFITAEDPRFVIHEADPVRSRVVRAALKTWDDETDKTRHAVVYLPELIAYFVGPLVKDKKRLWQASSWDVDTSEYDTGETSNPIGEVPVVPFINRNRFGNDGLGEFEDALDVQDRINSTTLDRLVIAKMQAYRQRWAKGIVTEDENGSPVSYDPGADLLWAVENDKAEFGDFAQADLSGILKAGETDVRDLAAVTRTPAHYLLASMVNISADTYFASDIGLASKALNRQRNFGERWEKVSTLSAIAAGKAARTDSEVVWRDPQTRTLAELYDAASKAGAAGVPWRERMEMLGKSDQQIDRMEANRVSDALLLAQYPQLEAAGTPVRVTENVKPTTDPVDGGPVQQQGSGGGGRQQQPPAGS